MRLIRAALVVLSVVAAACSQAPSAPCPADAALIKQYNANEADFAKLAASPEDKQLMAKLKIERIFGAADRPVRILFQVWYRDFPGPGGCLKGYAYLDEAPSSLVKDIDKNSDPGSPEVKELFRHIKGKWYVYYKSDN